MVSPCVECAEYQDAARSIAQLSGDVQALELIIARDRDEIKRLKDMKHMTEQETREAIQLVRELTMTIQDAILSNPLPSSALHRTRVYNVVARADNFLKRMPSEISP